MAFEQRPNVDVLVPLRHAEGEVAEWVWADVDPTREQALVLPRDERPVVPDDVADRIGHLLILLSAVIVRRHRRRPVRSYGSKVPCGCVDGVASWTILVSSSMDSRPSGVGTKPDGSTGQANLALWSGSVLSPASSSASLRMKT